MQQSRNTKLMLVVALVLAFGLLLVSCTPAPTPVAPTQAPPPPTAVPPTAAPAAPVEPAPAAPAPNEAKPFVVFGPGNANVPPGVPVYLRAGIAAPAEDAAADAPKVAEIKVVPMYPGMGEINPDNGRPKGVKSVRDDSNPASPDGVGDAPYAWTLVKAPDGSAAALAKEVADVPGLGKDVASFTPDKEVNTSSAWSSPTIRALRPRPASS